MLAGVSGVLGGAAVAVVLPLPESDQGPVTLVVLRPHLHPIGTLAVQLC